MKWPSHHVNAIRNQKVIPVWDSRSYTLMITIFFGGETGNIFFLGGGSKLLPLKYPRKNPCYVEKLSSEQGLWSALAAGREKEGELATTSLDFEYLHRKSRCEILIGGDDISNDVITLGTCFSMLFTFALTGGNLTAQSTGELGVEFKFQRRSCKLSFLFSPRRQSVPESVLAGYWKTVWQKQKKLSWAKTQFPPANSCKFPSEFCNLNNTKTEAGKKR